MTRKLNDILEINWLDVVDDPQWRDPNDARQRPKEVDCLSVGYYLKETKDLIWISWTRGDQEDGVRTREVIPKGCIKKIRKLT